MDLLAIFLAFFFGITSTADANLIMERRQTAVTYWDELDNFYARVKEQIPFTYVTEKRLHREDYSGDIHYEKYAQLPNAARGRAPTEAQQKQDFEDKVSICAHVLNSAFFKIRGEVALTLHLRAENESVKDNLRQYNRKVYDQIYPGMMVNGTMQWQNPYRRLTVSAGDRQYEEQVFGCVARHKDYPSQTFSPFVFKGYFISPVYHSNDFSLKGRFVFDDGLRLIAVAEEPATSDPEVVRVTRSTYYEEGLTLPPTFSPPATPNILRTFSKEEKLRFCAVVTSAFSDRIEFQPVEDNVEEECREREMHGSQLTSVSPSSVVSEEEVRYRDFMIGCRVIQLQSEERWTLYLSRGVDASTVIVWEATDEDPDLYEPIAGVRNVLLVKGRGAIPFVRIIVRYPEPQTLQRDQFGVVDFSERS